MQIKSDAIGVKAMKYNPGFLSDDELIASFCVRTHEFESIVETLRECDRSSNPHRLVIGPRGCGKTMLLLRVATEIRRNPELSGSLFPIVFAEESYEVATYGEFWLEALTRLTEIAPRGADEDDLHLTLDELRKIRDDQTLGRRCLGTLLEFSHRQGKRLVLIVENLNMLFRDLMDQDSGWQLRQPLQTEPSIILLASATSRFNEIDKPECAFYDLFVTTTLHPLNTEECSVLWKNVSSQDRSPTAMRGLEILTGGSPRLLSIVARFGSELSFHRLMGDLLELIDDITEYFKSHIEMLPAQERRVYLALADLWEPATAKEIAERARLDTSKCSALLNRLIDRGVVESAGGIPRRKLYYLTERLYNIYYLLRRSRTATPLIEALIRFMDAYYSPPQLKEFGTRIVQEASGLDSERQSLHWAALARLIDLPALESDRTELLSIVPEYAIPFFKPILERREESKNSAAEADVARTMVKQSVKFLKTNNHENVIVVCEKVVRRFGESKTFSVMAQVASALCIKGIALTELNRAEEAVAVCDGILQRYDNSDTTEMPEVLASALHSKGFALALLNKYEDAIVAYDKFIDRFGNRDEPVILEFYPQLLLNKGSALLKLNRPEEAIAVFNEIPRQFGDNTLPSILTSVLRALRMKGIILSTLGRREEAIAVFDEALQRLGSSNTPELLVEAADTLLEKGTTLSQLTRNEEAITVYEDIWQRFGDCDTPGILIAVLSALMRKGIEFARLNKHDEAIAVYEIIGRRLDSCDESFVVELRALALINTGISCIALNQPEKAIDISDEILQRYSTSELPTIHKVVALALVVKGEVFLTLDDENRAKNTWEEIMRRFGTSIHTLLDHPITVALCSLAYFACKEAHYEEAIMKIGQLFSRSDETAANERCKGYFIRAQAFLATGNPLQAERDVQMALTILPDLDHLLRLSIDVLLNFAVVLGVEHVGNLIKASHSAEFLVPLTVALDQELGLEPRVSLEIKEIARDIRKDLENRRSDNTLKVFQSNKLW